MEIDQEFPNGLTQISSQMETEFAGCLLMVGPPDVIGSGGVVGWWGGGVEGQSLVSSDIPASAWRRVNSMLDRPVSSMAYMRECREWWEIHAKHVGSFPDFSSKHAGRGDAFAKWWHEYKTWLLENRRGD